MKRNLIQCCSALALVAAVTPATAVAQDASEEDVIAVYGIRKSLADSAAIKRDARGVVDAITAEDIGDFPDTNLAESLQRITGVSIDRSNNEGSRVTVRGFGPDFNVVTLNGRQMPGADLGVTGTSDTRGFDFSNIAAEGVSGLEVYKTGRASNPSGGIGSVINVKTARPFDYDELTAAFTLNGLADLSVDDGDGDAVTPEVSGVLSQVFEGGFGKVGILFNGSYSERQSHTQNAQIDGWLSNQTLGGTINNNSQNPFGHYWTPRNLRWDQYDNKRERTNYQAVLQWAPTDKLTTTVDYTYSKVESETVGDVTGVWYNTGGNLNRIDIDENGTATFIDENNGSYDFFSYTNGGEQENESIGFNAEWEATDSLTLEFDYHKSDALSQGADNGNNSFAIMSIYLQNAPTGETNGGKTFENASGDIPGSTVTFRSDRPFAASSVDSTLAIANFSFQENSVEQFRLNGTWDNQSDSALKTISFGIARTEHEHQSQFANNFFNYGFGAGNEGVFDDGLFTEYSNDGTFDEFSLGGPIPSRAFSYDPLAVIAVGQAALAGGADFTPGDFDNDDNIKEETTAAFFAADFETEFNDMPLNVSAGLRYESTDVTSSSLQLIPTAVRWEDATEFFTVFSPDSSYNTVEGDGWDIFLPNLDMDLEVRDNLVTRFSYSRTATAPDLSNMYAGTSVAQQPKLGARTATGGNPNLQPYQSDNIDVTVEYYYNDSDYISIGYFKKFVDDFIVTAQVESPLFGLTDPHSGPRAAAAAATAGSTADVDVFNQLVLDGAFETRPEGNGIYGAADDDLIQWQLASFVNGESAEVDGWELAAQHSFGDTGFGAIANYTIVEGDVGFDRELIDVQFTIPGLSDSYNLVGYYDKNGIQARVAYNWRDAFLSAVGQQEGGALEPQFTEEYGQWDLGASYDVNDNFSVFFEGVNITNETQRVHGRYENQLLNARQFGARYSFGIRGKL